ncbi:uncharacterized protein K489DRAFT_85595 [Dissoconium aciculare CBS 342.82]|uniref:Uncharacterized protein n=1 Tax=Dissoconium aciculare CBS 342.82 TaxID=1314786 RepID=A0A6J3LT88_9PEZI|nr:uncharacterized protein K489DRAFT_85595 [Dissoconium aciculare CBS 342.82]KAF1818995.1 hypothetical protein K489DRAFT_85595 [Dissoconium aciculare CBS 342.82]
MYQRTIVPKIQVREWCNTHWRLRQTNEWHSRAVIADETDRSTCAISPFLAYPGGPWMLSTPGRVLSGGVSWRGGVLRLALLISTDNAPRRNRQATSSSARMSTMRLSIAPVCWTSNQANETGPSPRGIDASHAPVFAAIPPPLYSFVTRRRNPVHRDVPGYPFERRRLEQPCRCRLGTRGECACGGDHVREMRPNSNSLVAR